MNRRGFALKIYLSRKGEVFLLLPVQSAVAWVWFEGFCRMHFRRICSLLTPKENQKSASDFDSLDQRNKVFSPLIIRKKRSKRKKLTLRQSALSF